VLMKVRLNEQGILCGIEATRNIQGRHFSGFDMEAGRVNAFGYGQRMKINDAEDGFVKLLQFCPKG
jgi:hypothetical protein